MSRSGWFSERSTGYLASGRPVVAQNTAFDAWLPCGRGIVPFDSPATALDALMDVSADYVRHCRAARDIAAAYFDSSMVLTSLIERVAGRASSRTVADAS